MSKQNEYYLLMKTVPIGVRVHKSDKEKAKAIFGYAPIYYKLEDLRSEHGDDAPYMIIEFNEEKQE